MASKGLVRPTKKELSLANKMTEEKRYLTEDGDEIDISSLTEHGKEQLVSLEFVDQQLTQKNNERQVADSARVVYLSVLKSELNKVKSGN